MLAVAVACDVGNVMSKHLFRFIDRSFVQEEGGSIGSELTCVVAKIRMILWVRRLKQKCLVLGLRIVLSCVYVDDSFFVVKKRERGLQFDGVNLVLDQEQLEKDDLLEDDFRMARLLVSVANSIDTDIQMTFDCPSQNPGGRMPVLDLGIWYEENVIYFMFYEKPMSSRFVIMKESALPWRTKKIVLAGELFRRLINTSPVLVERGDARDSIRDFHYKLLLSGYNENERAMIMREGLSRYENIKKQVQEGKRPWYRLASWNKQSRAVRKVVKSKRWYGENEAVFFAEPSPGGMFKETVDKIMKESGFKVKVVEKAGASLESKLQRSDLAGEKRCSDKECAVCSTVDSGGCWKESVGYEMSCEECAENGHRYV